MALQNVQILMAALGDPSRRAIFDLLSNGPLAVGEIAGKLPITRSAVSQHLRVLGEAGLVLYEARGTRNLYRLDPDAVAEIRDYLDAVWTKALTRFKARAEKTRK
jgi:DNA-binding transcriptional ArsR family regulator